MTWWQSGILIAPPTPLLEAAGVCEVGCPALQEKTYERAGSAQGSGSQAPWPLRTPRLRPLNPTPGDSPLVGHNLGTSRRLWWAASAPAVWRPSPCSCRLSSGAPVAPPSDHMQQLFTLPSGDCLPWEPAVLPLSSLVAWGGVCDSEAPATVYIAVLFRDTDRCVIRSPHCPPGNVHMSCFVTPSLSEQQCALRTRAEWELAPSAFSSGGEGGALAAGHPEGRPSSSEGPRKATTRPLPVSSILPGGMPF